MLPQLGGFGGDAPQPSPRQSRGDGDSDDVKEARGAEDGPIARDSKETPDASPGNPGASGLAVYMRKLRRLATQHKRWLVALAWALTTAYFIAALALRKKTQASDVLPFIFLYVFITGRIAFYFVPTQPLTSRIGRASGWVDRTLVQRVPAYMRYAAGGLVLLALFLSVALGLGVD
ncbi:hypothetical protein IWQ56_002317, partial [Coemansia nantahalensis]